MTHSESRCLVFKGGIVLCHCMRGLSAGVSVCVRPVFAYSACGR